MFQNFLSLICSTVVVHVNLNMVTIIRIMNFHHESVYLHGTSVVKNIYIFFLWLKLIIIIIAMFHFPSACR